MPERRKISDEPVSASLKRVDLQPCKFFLSTGSTLLDLSVSDRHPGGVGSGRVVQVIGDNSTAKSVVLKEILGSAQRLGGHAIELDAEYTPDFARAGLFGLDVGDWKDEVTHAENIDKPLCEAVKVCPSYTYRNPSNLEQLFDHEIGPALMLTEGLVPDGVDKKTSEVRTKEADFSIRVPLAIGVDTFTALASSAEERRDLDVGSYNMERAKTMSGGFRKWIKHVGRTDSTIIAVDHIRSAVGVTFGPQWTTSGGKAMQQYASTRIFLAHAGTIKNKLDHEIGIWVRAKCVKNKIAPPFREVRFAVLFDYGVDDVRSNLAWLHEQKTIPSKLTINGAWYSWGDGRLGCGEETAIRAIEDNDLEKELEQEVVRVWRILYAPPARKVKER